MKTTSAPIPTTPELTPEMERAREVARSNGGVLDRFPGGFWKVNDADARRPFKSATVEALVTRGLARYTKLQPRSHAHDRRPPFPIRVLVLG